MTKSSQRVEMREMNREEDQTNNEIKQKARERYYFKSLSTSLTVYLKLLKDYFTAEIRPFRWFLFRKNKTVYQKNLNISLLSEREQSLPSVNTKDQRNSVKRTGKVS